MITLTIFSIVAAISLTVMVNTLKSTKRIQSQVFLYTEAEAAMDQIARSVERGTIDYEAYYLRNVQDETGWTTEDYGWYGQTFHDPGTGGPDVGFDGTSPDYGAECADGSGTYPEACPTGLPVSSQQDRDEGLHPYDSAADAEDMNAMCEGGAACADLDNYFTDEIILINGAGDERTVFALQAFDRNLDDYHLAKLRLMGTDSAEPDGIVDTWEYMSSYTGTDGDIRDFEPITPSAIDIQGFYVIIAPVEDPYRAFAEGAVQVQPQVTIIMTVSLSDDYSSGLLGDAPVITLQRTVSSGVYGEVVSYE